MYINTQQWKKEIIDYIKSENKDEILKILKKLTPEELNSVDDHNETIIHYIADYINYPNIEISNEIINRMNKDAVNFVNQADGFHHSYTALHYAIDGWDKELAKLLISKMSLKGLTPCNKNVWQLSHYAEKQSMWEITDLIEERIEILENELWEEMKVASDIYYKDPYETRGFTLLDCTEQNHKKATELIYEIINKTNSYYKTVIDIAIEKGANAQICKLFLDKISDKDLYNTNCIRGTLFHKCAQYNQIDVLKMLLSYRSLEGINKIDGWGETALHVAIKNNNFEIAKLLVENMTIEGIETKNDKNKTALDLLNSTKEIMMKVLAEITNKKNILHVAVEQNDINGCKLIINKDNNHQFIKNEDGDTPLDVSIKKGYKEIEELLRGKLNYTISE